MVAGDHDRADAGAAGALHGGLRLFARRVYHPDEADKDQLLFQALIHRAGVERVRGQLAQRHAQCPQRLPGKLFVRTQNLLAPLSGQRTVLPAHQFVRTARHQNVRSALREREHPLFALGVGVNGGHELALGRKRYLGHPLETGIQRLAGQPRLARRHDERALGRVALHRPPPVVLLQHGVVGPVAHRKRALEFYPVIAVQRGSARDGNVARGSVSRSAQAHLSARRGNRAHGHLVARERAGLVGGDDVGRPERFDRRQTPHDGVALRHALHAHGEHGGHHRGKPLRNGGHGKRHAQNQNIEQRRKPPHMLHRDDCADHHDGDDDDDDAEHLAEPVQLFLQGGGLLRGFFEHAGNAPQLGAGAGGGYDGLSAPVGGGGAAEEHVAPVTQRSLFIQRRDILGNGQALAGESGLGHLKGGGLQQSRIGGDGIAFLHQNDVPGHNLGGGNAAALPPAHHGGERGGHMPQRGHGRFGPGFLNVAHQGVQHNDREDSDGLVRKLRVALHQPQHGRDGRRDQQQDHEHILELRQEPAPRGSRLFGRKLVAPVLIEPRPRLVLTQPIVRLHSQRRKDHFRRLEIGLARYRGSVSVYDSLFLFHSAPTSYFTPATCRATSTRQNCPQPLTSEASRA